MRGLICVMMVAALVVLGGCDETHDSIMKKSLATMEDMVEILESIKDEASAKAAVSKMQALSEDMKKLKEEADKLGKPDAETEKKLKEKHEARAKELATKMMKESSRIAMDPNLRKQAQEALGKLRM